MFRLVELCQGRHNGASEGGEEADEEEGEEEERVAEGSVGVGPSDSHESANHRNGESKLLGERDVVLCRL